MQTIQSGPLNTLNVDAVADITKLLELPDQNTQNNLKSYCELRYFLILRLKTGMDEGNFNLSGNLFHNIGRISMFSAD